MSFELVVIILLILLNGFFSLVELAVISSRKSKLENLAKKGKSGAKVALDILANPNRFLSTIQAGINLIAIFIGVFTGASYADDIEAILVNISFIAPYAHAVALSAVVFVVTFFTIVFGELVPKRIGMHFPETIAVMFASTMMLLSAILGPFVWLLSKITDLVLAIFNIRGNPENAVTEEEVVSLIAQGTSSGTFEESEQDMVERVFHLSDRQVGSLMTNRIDCEWLDINEGHYPIREFVLNSSHSLFPVCDDSIDNVIGVLRARKMLLLDNHDPDADVRSILEPAVFVPENMSAFKVLEKFRESKSKLAVVIDEFGAVQGIVTVNDLFDALLADADAPDGDDETLIIRREDGSWLIDALLPFEEFLQYFEIDEVDVEDKTGFHTLGGFMLHLSKEIPKTGEKFEWRDISFEVLDMDGNRVDKILVIMPDDGSEE